jgi:hypothetical protein
MEWTEINGGSIIPKDQDILVCVEYTRKIIVLQFTGHGWLNSLTGHYTYVSVTHWMPLPEPPKE